MQSIENMLEMLANLIWGNWLIFTLMGVGLYFTILTKCIQITRFPFAIYEFLIKPFRKVNAVTRVVKDIFGLPRLVASFLLLRREWQEQLVMVLNRHYATGWQGDFIPMKPAKVRHLFLHAAAITDHPVRQALFGIAMILFAFSSIPVQWYFGQVGLNHLMGSKINKWFQYFFISFTFVGSFSSLKLVWYLQDLILGVLIIPNLIAIVLLSPQVVQYTNDFFSGGMVYRYKHKENVAIRSSIEKHSIFASESND